MDILVTVVIITTFLWLIFPLIQEVTTPTLSHASTTILPYEELLSIVKEKCKGLQPGSKKTIKIPRGYNKYIMQRVAIKMARRGHHIIPNRCNNNTLAVIAFDPRIDLNERVIGNITTLSELYETDDVKTICFPFTILYLDSLTKSLRERNIVVETVRVIKDSTFISFSKGKPKCPCMAGTSSGPPQ